MYSAPIQQQIVWEPQPGPQTALLECDVFEIFFGGARGGGKTEGSIGDWLQHSSTYGQDAIGIFFRRKLVQLAEAIARTHQIFPKLGAKWNEQKKTWTMPGGGRLKFAYLERDSDAEEYQGHSYTRVYVEEVTNFPSAGPLNKLRATLRSGAGVPVGMRLTGNPGGAGHNWVKARYITPEPRGFKVIEESCEIDDPDTGEKRTVSLSRVFIPSKISDNMLIMRNDPTYILRLRQSGSEALVKAWLEGNWDIVDGAFFDEWSDQHVLRTSDFLRILPPHATRFRSFDWGSARPFSVGWYIVSDGAWGIPKDALLKYREWYGADGPNKGLKLTVSQVAKGILEREKDEVIRYGVADPAIFIHDGGPSKAEEMSILGCSWRRADNKRVAGAQQMHLRLRGDQGVPMLYVLDCCEDTIRTIPTLQHDELNPEDLDTEGEDHAYDETRYAVMSRPWLARALVAGPGALGNDPGSLGKTFNQLVAQNKRKRLAAQS